MADCGIDWGKLKSKLKNKLKRMDVFHTLFKVVLSITVLYSLGYFFYLFIYFAADCESVHFLSRALPLAIINGCSVIALSMICKRGVKIE